MSTDHISKFISDVAVQFSPPKYDTPSERDAWLRSVVTALHGSSPEVLDRAAQIIIGTRKNRYFPLVAECHEAIRKAADEIKFEKHVQTLPELREAAMAEYSPEREKWAEALIKCELGREAARGGWILALRDLAARLNRLPDHRRYEPRNHKERLEYGGCTEVEFCKRSAKAFDEAYLAVIRGGGGTVMLERLGASMLKTRERLRAEVLGQ